MDRLEAAGLNSPCHCQDTSIRLPINNFLRRNLIVIWCMTIGNCGAACRVAMTTQRGLNTGRANHEVGASAGT